MASAQEIRTPRPVAPRKDRYAGLQYPQDARQFRGWRHHGDQIPIWEVHPTLPKDVFTFARLRYPYRRGLRWQADYPEAELHLSWRLHQLTSVQVNPFPVIVDLEVEQLREHPFLFISEPSNMNLSDEQARLLGDYMRNGGFILIDDFWGGDEWRIFAPTLKRIWPDSDPVELKHSLACLTSRSRRRSTVTSIGPTFAKARPTPQATKPVLTLQSPSFGRFTTAKAA